MPRIRVKIIDTENQSHRLASHERRNLIAEPIEIESKSAVLITANLDVTLAATRVNITAGLKEPYMGLGGWLRATNYIAATGPNVYVTIPVTVMHTDPLVVPGEYVVAVEALAFDVQPH